MKLLLSILVAGCIVQAQSALGPQSTGNGALTCRQIVEQCDSQCGTNPMSAVMCIRACTDQGNPDSARLHAAVVDCAQRNGCLDEPCIRERCAEEATACQGPPDEAKPEEPKPTEPAGPAG